MDSKAMSTSVAVILIIFLATVLVLIPSIGKTLTFFTSRSDIEACRQSVEIRANSKVLGIDLTDFPLNCKQKEPVFFESKKNWDKDAKQEIADAMYDCWYMYGEGELDFLSDYDFGLNDVSCYVCSSFVFDDSLKGKQITDFDNYLIENGYADYLFGNDYNKQVVSGLFSQIPTDKTLYVLFVADKSKSLDNFKNLVTAESGAIFVSSCIIGAKVGGTIGLLAGGASSIPGAIIGCLGSGVVASGTYAFVKENNYIPYIYLTNAEDVNNICK